MTLRSELSFSACSPWRSWAASPRGQAVLLWEFAEWRDHDDGSGMKLVTEPSNDRTGGYVLAIWDLLAATMTGVPATLTVAAYNEGNTFFGKGDLADQRGVFGNTVGGDAFILVRKHYRKDSDVSSLRFTYSSAFLEVMDYGSGKPPWFSPYAADLHGGRRLRRAELPRRVRVGTRRRRALAAQRDLGIDLHDTVG